MKRVCHLAEESHVPVHFRQHQNIKPNDVSSSVKAQSRSLSHALSSVGTGQVPYMPSPGQNASDENKGASAGCAESTLHARTPRDGTAKWETIKTTVDLLHRDGKHCDKQLRQLFELPSTRPVYRDGDFEQDKTRQLLSLRQLCLCTKDEKKKKRTDDQVKQEESANCARKKQQIDFMHARYSCCLFWTTSGPGRRVAVSDCTT